MPGAFVNPGAQVPGSQQDRIAFTCMCVKTALC